MTPATTSAHAGRGRRPDAVTVLTVYLVLLLGVPSALTISALGSVGRPSILWGLVCLAWWAWSRLAGDGPTPATRRPVAVALAVLVVVALVSYAAAQVRGLPAVEASPADAALLRLASWAGVVLAASDQIASRDRYVTLLRRLATGGALVAALGLAQFATGQGLVVDPGLPGLALETGGFGIQGRGQFTRAAGTASHPLEYAVVLSATLPLALAFALEDRSRGALRRWLPVATIALASALSVSRSALLGIGVGLLVLLPAWPRRRQVAALAAAAAGFGVVYLAVPGMLGTLAGMFLGLGTDSSVESRTGSYGTAFQIAERFRLLGRGLGTFLPQYRIVDNQYLQLLIELGVLGLLALLALLVTAGVCAVVARRRSEVRLDRHLAQSLLASLASVAVLLLFFDAFTFPQAAGLLMLAVGLAGAAPRVLAAPPATPAMLPATGTAARR